MSLILVVEDERLVAKDLQRHLVSLGYRVPSTAANGDDALRLAAELSPDLVLMDIRIQGTRDGVETAALLRHLDIPVVFLTAYTDEETRARATLARPRGFLTKPISPDELRIAVERALQVQ